jgi:glycosyltransferase involved in cell wall biosynthesis
VSVHLVEVGLAWPPDTFLRHKLGGLAARGMRVTVVANAGSPPTRTPEGIEVVPMPDWSLRFHRRVAGAVRASFRLWRRRPALLRRALAVAMQQPLMRRPRWLWLLAEVAELEPDVVHFEWESAAIKYLPLVDLWSCPMTMSCHGGLDLYSSSPTVGPLLSEVWRAFDRAAAVHCVSEAVLAEATRHGLAPEKARLLRAGVDLERFRPRAAADRRSA